MSSKNAPSTSKEPFDVTGFTLAYEDGQLDEEAVVAGFQELINTGLAWQLQGAYGRTAKSLIESGHCTPATPAVSAQTGLPERVANFEKITRDETKVIGDEKYRLVIYGQYNAMGLIGPENNGIGVLDENKRSVVSDSIACGKSAAEKNAMFDRLMSMDGHEFATTINQHSRTRFEIPVPTAPRKVRGPGR